MEFVLDDDIGIWDVVWIESSDISGTFDAEAVFLVRGDVISKDPIAPNGGSQALEHDAVATITRDEVVVDQAIADIDCETDGVTRISNFIIDTVFEDLVTFDGDVFDVLSLTPVNEDPSSTKITYHQTCDCMVRTSDGESRKF